MSSVNEDVGIQGSSYTDVKTADWCNHPREPSSSFSVLSQAKYMHTLGCKHSVSGCMFQRKFSCRPLRGHAQSCSSQYYLWYQGVGGNLAACYYGNIQGKHSKGTLWLHKQLEAMD